MPRSSALDILRRRNPEWFKEHEDGGWGLEVVSSVRGNRWFITSEQSPDNPDVLQFKVWEYNLASTIRLHSVCDSNEAAHATIDDLMPKRPRPPNSGRRKTLMNVIVTIDVGDHPEGAGQILCDMVITSLAGTTYMDNVTEVSWEMVKKPVGRPPASSRNPVDLPPRS